MPAQVQARRWSWDGTTFRRRGSAPAGTGGGGPTPPTRQKISTLRVSGDTLNQALGRLSTPTVVELDQGSESFSGFINGRSTNQGYGLFNNNILGFYIPDPNELSMVANTSTDAATINALGSGATNNFSLIRIGHSPGLGPNTNPYFSGTLRGTNQGSNYNGLLFYYATNGLIEFAKIYGMPGSASAPPGETFMTNLDHCTGMTIRNSTWDGQGIAAAALGFNNASGGYVADCTFQNLKYSACVTHYKQTNGITYERCVFNGSHNYGTNFEKCSGTIIIRDCTYTNVPAAEACVDTDGASAQVYFYDPVWDGKSLGTKFRVKVHRLYNYPPPAVDPNGQLASDIHLIIGGVDVSATRLQIITT